MQRTSAAQIRNAYKNCGGIPRILLTDTHGFLNIETKAEFLSTLCGIFKVKATDFETVEDVRQLLSEVTILCHRYNTVVLRNLRETSLVVYDGLPLVRDSYRIESITNDFLVQLSNRIIVHPMWMRRK